MTDITVSGLSPTGIGIAGISVVTSGLQQIMCGQIQRKYNLTANQLLSNSAPLQVRHRKYTHSNLRFVYQGNCATGAYAITYWAFPR